ncbi:MAG: Ig-like domain-containing protein [Clostridia bacterium]|nr:Ig-like domain-containing protein [Clostridia bacterium]
MNKNLLMRALALCALLLLLLAPCASAQIVSGEETVELFSEGGLPSVQPVSPVSAYSLRSASDFDAYIIGELEKQTAQIDVSSYEMTVAEIKAAYQNLLNANPQLFYVSGGFRYSYYESTGLVVALLPEYKYSGDDLQSRIAAFNASLSAIVDYASKSSTDIGQILRTNTYFCTTFQYDTSYTNYAPDELFSSGKGVCQAYMLGFRAVMNELGIACETATSDAMNHTWNLVQLNGSWYHIDVTWNDPITDRPIGAYYTNFLLSDAGITAAEHYDWEASVTAGSTKYDDFFWTTIKTPLSVVNNVVYYADPDAAMLTVKAWPIGASASDTVYTASFTSYGGGYDPVQATSSRVYFVDARDLYSVDFFGQDLKLEYSSSDLYITRLLTDGMTMQIYLDDVLGGYTGTLTSIPLDLNLSLILDQNLLDLIVDTSIQLTAAYDPEMDAVPNAVFTSSNEAVATVDAAGMVTGVAPGAAIITAVVGDSLTAECLAIVHGETQAVIPAGTLAIGEEAFAGIVAQEIILPEGLESIGSGAFAGCAQLRLINLPLSATDIAADALDGAEGVMLLVLPESEGLAFAKANGLVSGADYFILPDVVQ